MFPQPAAPERIDGEYACPEDEHDDGSDEERVGCGRVKFIGVREDREQGFTIGGDVGDGHVHGEDKRRQARGYAECQKNTAKKLEARDKQSGLWGERQTQ